MEGHGSGIWRGGVGRQVLARRLARGGVERSGFGGACCIWHAWHCCGRGLISSGHVSAAALAQRRRTTRAGRRAVGSQSWYLTAILKDAGWDHAGAKTLAGTASSGIGRDLGWELALAACADGHIGRGLGRSSGIRLREALHERVAAGRAGVCGSSGEGVHCGGVGSGASADAGGLCGGEAGGDREVAQSGFVGEAVCEVVEVDGGEEVVGGGRVGRVGGGMCSCRGEGARVGGGSMAGEARDSGVGGLASTAWVWQVAGASEGEGEGEGGSI